jgi:hypothetical protein
MMFQASARKNYLQDQHNVDQLHQLPNFSLFLATIELQSQ